MRVRIWIAGDDGPSQDFELLDPPRIGERISIGIGGRTEEGMVMSGPHDAWAADCPDTEYHDLVDRRRADAQEYLGDADEMRGYLERPVGETVAKLCAALDPEACERDGDTWRVRERAWRHHPAPPWMLRMRSLPMNGAERARGAIDHAGALSASSAPPR